MLYDCCCQGANTIFCIILRKEGKDTSSQGSVDADNMDVVPYEPVTRQDLNYCRPIIILGPLTELLNDRLVNDCPEIFNR